MVKLALVRSSVWQSRSQPTKELSSRYRAGDHCLLHLAEYRSKGLKEVIPIQAIIAAVAFECVVVITTLDIIAQGNRL